MEVLLQKQSINSLLQNEAIFFDANGTDSEDYGKSREIFIEGIFENKFNNCFTQDELKMLCKILKFIFNNSFTNMIKVLLLSKSSVGIFRFSEVLVLVYVYMAVQCQRKLLSNLL